MVQSFSCGWRGSEREQRSGSGWNFGAMKPINPRPSFHSCRVLARFFQSDSGFWQGILKDGIVCCFAEACNVAFLLKLVHHVKEHLWQTYIFFGKQKPKAHVNKYCRMLNQNVSQEWVVILQLPKSSDLYKHSEHMSSRFWRKWPSQRLHRTWSSAESAALAL